MSNSTDTPAKKTFWIMWTYVGNYGGPSRWDGATTAEEAAKQVSDGLSRDFRARGRIYVFDSPPAFTFPASTEESGR